jgi:hypothetical protein
MSHPQLDRETELMQTFEKNSSRLYSLAFLLTGDIDRSVEAFDKALDVDEPVRDGFMDEWARRLVIVAALATMERELLASIRRTLHRAVEEPSGYPSWKRRARIARAEFEAAVLAIDPFPRCAMLLTVFEGMSIKLAAVLLHANEALTSVAQRLGIVQLTRNLAGDSIEPLYSGHE